MNVLLVNPRYPQTFWSFESVLAMLGRKVLEPPLGLLTVAALLPADWELTLVDLTAREISSTEWQAADVVMLTGMGCQHASLIRTVRAAKRRGKPVVVGGSYAFHLPNALLDAGVDIVVRGEAEAIIPELRDALAERRSGIVIEGVERPELAASPVPRFDLLDLDQYVEMSIQFSRGCPYHCEFCDITLMFGHRVRTKPGERIIAELQTLFDLGWKDYIFFTDDNFIGNPSKAKTLLRKMVDWNAARGYPYQFVTQASVNLANDPELLDLMVKAGFTKVFLGIETPDRESLVLSKKVQNVATNMDDACRTINRAGLQIIAGCILGFDNERPRADLRLFDFAVRNHIPEMFITPLQVGPGTGLFHRMQKEGRLLTEAYATDVGSNTGIPNFRTTRPVGDIMEEVVHLYEVLYDTESYLGRVYRCLLHMRPPPIRKTFRLPAPEQLRAVAITFFRQGIKRSTRRVFWKYLIMALLRFPARIDRYVMACISGEHYHEFRSAIRARWEARQAGNDGND
jgi:radical SAM superfamily enzyme YgiQ (UPF0313 family)